MTTTLSAMSTTFNRQSLLSTVTLYSLLWILLVGTGARALTCFESNEDGDMVEVTSDDYTYCVLFPERIDNNKYLEGKAFGVGPSSDSTTTYDKIFQLNNELYQILSMCVYERYDFGKISPKFSFKQPEYLLRCFCNFDGCNREKNFFGYIGSLKTESATLNTKTTEETRN